jgi:predicted nucleotidyltransferase
MDKEITEILEKFRFALKEQGIKVSRFVLFGSCASAKATEASDIDIAVVSEDFKDINLLKRLELIGLALAKAKIFEPIEALAYTEEEFASKGQGTFIGDEIKSKGIQII